MKKTKQKPKHDIHNERLAIAGFIIAVLFALGVFYYIYQVQQTYGKSIEGLRSYSCLQWQKENCPKGEENCPCPSFTLQIPEKRQCCCDLPGEGRFSKYGIYVDVPIGATELVYATRCEEGCAKGGARLLNTGRCRWIDIS